MSPKRLAVAVLDEIEKRKQVAKAQTFRNKAWRQDRDLMKCEIEEQLRAWFVDELAIELPEEVTVVVDRVMRIQSGQFEFDFKLLLRGHQHNHIVFPARSMFFLDGMVTKILPIHWFGVGVGVHQSKFEKFIDAVIFALGGERGLQQLGVIS
jgi:hypothetical protein